MRLFRDLDSSFFYEKYLLRSLMPRVENSDIETDFPTIIPFTLLSCHSFLQIYSIFKGTEAELISIIGLIRPAFPYSRGENQKALHNRSCGLLSKGPIARFNCRLNYFFPNYLFPQLLVSLITCALEYLPSFNHDAVFRLFQRERYIPGPEHRQLPGRSVCHQ